jgi:hypothetical protein
MFRCSRLSVLAPRHRVVRLVSEVFAEKYFSVLVMSVLVETHNRMDTALRSVIGDTVELCCT